MLLVGGIDPGVSGAIALYDVEADKLVAVFRIPSFKVAIGKSMRTRIDVGALQELVQTCAFMGCQFLVIEDVQGGNYRGKKQSASGAFQFGVTFGLLLMAAKSSAIDYTTASPAVWKLVERVPSDAKAIVIKAEASFPEHVDLFRGPQGGSYHDMAEAAFLARYAARHVWPSRQPRAGLRTTMSNIGAGLDISTEEVKGRKLKSKKNNISKGPRISAAKRRMPK